MKKFNGFILLSALVLASCGSKGYKMTGTVEGAEEGDTVFLLHPESRELVKIDSAIVKNGQFEFTGVQDSAVYHYLSYKGENDIRPTYVDFFLENGEIKATIAQEKENNSVKGTPTNDAFQRFRENLQAVLAKQTAKYEEFSELSEEEQTARMSEIEDIDKEISSTIKSEVDSNIATPLGAFLVKAFYYYMDDATLEELIVKLPETYQNDADIVKIKDRIEAAKNTAVGKTFIDLELNDPNGNPVKLSDYVGKGKVVLVDFWASWCGPCRREMPNLVELYAKYKNKNFEIVGVSFDRTAEAWVKGIADLNITWPQMSDLGYWESSAVKVYAISSIPHVILIDGDGTIVARGLHGVELKQKVAELLK